MPGKYWAHSCPSFFPSLVLLSSAILIKLLHILLSSAVILPSLHCYNKLCYQQRLMGFVRSGHGVWLRIEYKLAVGLGAAWAVKALLHLWVLRNWNNKWWSKTTANLAHVEMVSILPCGLAVTGFPWSKAKKQQVMFIPVSCHQALRPSQEPGVKPSCFCSLQPGGVWPSLKKPWLRLRAARNKKDASLHPEGQPFTVPTEGIDSYL